MIRLRSGTANCRPDEPVSLMGVTENMRWSSICLLGFLALGVSAAEPPPANPLEVGVDPRVELLSILFRLAGNPEYGRGQVAGYLKDIDQHFAPVREHAAVKLARELRRTRGVGFDAPMSLAIHLQDAETLAERLPFEPRPASLDPRWQPAEARRFLEEVRNFAREAKFAEFLQSHKPLYDETNRRARQLLEREARLEWFGRFFGARPGAQFRAVPALVNGASNYGPQIKAGASEELYCILGVWRTDTNGLPVFDREALETVAHEFCHSYVNPLVSARTKELESAGSKLFAPVREQMQRMAYGNWQTMMHESLVRAAVVRYLDVNQGRLAATRQVMAEQKRGFAWTLELAQLLETYEDERDQYRDFGAFMPRIIEFFDDYADRLTGKTGPDLPVPRFANERPAAAGTFRADYAIYWPPEPPTNTTPAKTKPLLVGNLFGVVAGNKLALTLNVTRPPDERQRWLWNSSLAFPEHEWMAQVRVWDTNETWLWPNLVYLLKLHGKDREERYGGWDPGKQIDNDFAAVLIRQYDSTGQELPDTQKQPLVSAHWHALGAAKQDKQTIVHEARSDEFVVQLFDESAPPAQGRLKVWLIYADLLGHPVPKRWPKEPEFNGGILTFFQIDWQVRAGQATVATCTNVIPDAPTGFDWKSWVGREKQTDAPKAPARVRNF